jgi:hypothetical protein
MSEYNENYIEAEARKLKDKLRKRKKRAASKLKRGPGSLPQK